MCSGRPLVVDTDKASQNPLARVAIEIPPRPPGGASYLITVLGRVLNSDDDAALTLNSLTWHARPPGGQISKPTTRGRQNRGSRFQLGFPRPPDGNVLTPTKGCTHAG
jgi:hypothetical protein